MRTSRATIRISRRLRSAERGVSLIEMMLAIVILGIVASIALPNVNSVIKSRAAKALDGKIADLPMQAESQAIKLKTPVDLRVQGTTIVMEQVPLDGSTPTQLSSLDLGDLQVVSSQLNGQDQNVSSWQWQAYPDGSTDQGGLGILDGAQDKALMISATGDVTWKMGQPPEATDSSWAAGQFQPNG